MRRSGTIGSLLALALAFGAAGVHAQDLGLGDDGLDDDGLGDDGLGDDGLEDTAAPPASDVERARQEFAAGIACIEEHETRCAIGHFRTALELHDAPAIRYNLASALFEVQEYPEAARLVAAVLADEETPEELRGHTEALQAQLSERGGTLEITVTGAVEGAEVQIDDAVVPPSQLAAVIVAPGARVVTLERDGTELARREIEVAAGQRVPVELAAPPSPEEVAAQAPIEEPGGDTGPAFYEEWPFWTIVAGGAALVAIVIIAVVVANDNASIEDPVQGNYEPGILRWD